MRQYFTIIIVVVILTSIWLSGCGVSDDDMSREELQREQKELQAEVETLQEELKQLHGVLLLIATKQMHCYPYLAKG